MAALTPVMQALGERLGAFRSAEDGGRSATCPAPGALESPGGSTQVEAGHPEAAAVHA